MSRFRTFSPTPDPLERQLASLTAPEPSPALPERLRAIAQHDPLPPRRPSRRPLVLAAGLAVMLLIAAVVTTLPTRHQVAFADVVRSMRGVKAAYWRHTFIQCDPTGQPVIQDSDYSWARLSPAVEVDCSALQIIATPTMSASFTESFRDDHINIYRTKANDSNDLYQIYPYRVQVGGLRKDTLDGLTFSQQTYDNTPYYKEMPWQSQQIAFDGREALQFQRDYFDGKQRRVGTETVLVDPKTNHFLRTELRQVDPATGVISTIMTNDLYRYNADVPTATFDIAPPLGKTVTIQDGRPDDALTPGERRQIEMTVDKSNAAYRAGDFAGFAVLWDFDYHRALPKLARSYPGDAYRKLWKTRIAAQKQSGAQAAGRLIGPVTLTPAPYAYTRHSRAEAFPPSPPPGRVRVKATWKFIRRNGAVTQHPVIYDLRREDGGYKVYYWHETIWGTPD